MTASSPRSSAVRNAPPAASPAGGEAAVGLRRELAITVPRGRFKDLKTEMFRIIYEQAIYPANLYSERAPMKHAEYAEKVTSRQIALMHERGIFSK